MVASCFDEEHAQRPFAVRVFDRDHVMLPFHYNKRATSSCSMGYLYIDFGSQLDLPCFRLSRLYKLPER